MAKVVTDEPGRHSLEVPLMHRPAQEPNDLERFFVERANARDVEGLVALYEPNAIIDSGDGEVARGSDQIREFLIRFLDNHPQLVPSDQARALCSEDIALTSSRLRNGDTTAEIARRQADGTWLWVVDQFRLAGPASTVASGRSARAGDC